MMAEIESDGSVSFVSGETFPSYDDLKKKVEDYEKLYSVQMSQ